MCICINCRHIHHCLTYEFIQNQHYKQSRNVNDSMNFIPINTIIDVNLTKKKNSIYIDWDLIECLSFVERPGYWLQPRN